MCGPCLARTNHYGDPAELAKAIARFKAQGFRAVKTRTPNPGEYLVGEKLGTWGESIGTIQWRAKGAPLPFRQGPDARPATAPRPGSTADDRERAILGALGTGSKTRGDLLFELRKIGGEKAIEEAIQALIARGEIFARVERHRRHRFFRADRAADALTVAA